ncbi:8-amino-7-oxononanoate synthase [Desulfurobacterium indicum]|uniref:8-amino-7-ketopelargonate synthase n=1 Tax=Desulfurobacterium indicum TaxID=1914305 RepID=A0A1R1MK45_9BACT|nr:8-amino-7-oxononanoate synthase [Desulfurobacterium indicum]OMH40139.1 8-amino-7-oxononanoate synthase [Desulfurobacterium indicum]
MDIKKIIKTLKGKNLYRQLKTIERAERVYVYIDGKRYINFSSNDYLSLAFDAELNAKHQNCLKKWPAGSGAARLVTGNFSIHEELEKKLAEIKKTEAALLFSCGYMANLGILSSLLGEKDAIFSDELNHASLIDGCRLSKAKVFIYKHRDTNHLKELLKKNRDKFETIAIVTDSVFSMDGDIAPLDELLKLAKDYNAYLIIDDAHATGVIGNSSLDFFNLKPTKRTIIMGTLGKALGTFGAFVASTKEMKEFFTNRARTFIFTTAIPPHIACMTLENLKEIQPRMVRLRKNIYLFSKLTGIKSQTAIFPLIIGDSGEALKISEKLLKKGFIIPAIRPPTVPEGTARLRITIAAGHSEEELRKLAETIKSLI